MTGSCILAQQQIFCHPQGHACYNHPPTSDRIKRLPSGKGAKHLRRLREYYAGVSLTTVRAGAWLAVYDGVYTAKEPANTEYAMRVPGGYVNGANSTAPSRAINHSCSPNAEVQVWESPWLRGPERFTLVIVALELLYKGNEVTIDYGWSEEAMLVRYNVAVGERVCACMSAACVYHAKKV
jgi:hypothetical protein